MTPFGRLRSRLGVALSAFVLAYGVVAALFAYFGPDCFEASETVAWLINRVPLVVLTAIVAALVLDVQAMLSGGRAARWGRWGLGLLGLGLIIAGWAFVDALGDLLACAEGD